MTRRLLSALPLALTAAFAAAGCSDDPAGPPPPDAGSADAASGTPDAGVAPPGLAVVNSDYKSTSVSLLDPATGAVTRDGCLHSGTRAPQLVAALSGDVVLPSQPQPGSELVLIDRMHATLTWVDPRTCAVLRQLAVGQGFAANPHDLAAVSPTKAYVTRYGANPSRPDEGSDLLIIDPAAARAIGRVDLAPHAPPSPAADKPILAAPDRAVVARDRVYVLLGNMSADFKVAAPGRVLALDPATDTVTARFDLPFRNCASLSYVPGAHALVVACGGLFGDARQLEESGVVWVDLAVTPPLLKTVPARAFGSPVSPFVAVAVSAAQAFAVVPGQFGGMPPDQLWALDFAGGTPRKLLDASDAFTLGSLALDPAARRLYVADGSEKMPRLRIYDVADPAQPTAGPVTPTGAAGLPPRALAFY